MTRHERIKFDDLAPRDRVTLLRLADRYSASPFRHRAHASVQDTLACRSCSEILWRHIERIGEMDRREKELGT